MLVGLERVSAGGRLADAAARLSGRTQALVVTHMWGRPVDLAAARAFADQHGLGLVEDCSHAHGVRWHGEPVGNRADVAVFSLGTTKMVTGGQAGAFVTRDTGIYERAIAFGQPKNRVLRRVSDPQLRQLALSGVGNNLRPSPVAAVLAADHLRRLTTTTTVKNANIAKLSAILARFPDLQTLPVGAARSNGTLYKFHCRWNGDQAELPKLASRLRGAGMRVRLPAQPLHTLPLFHDAEVAALAGGDEVRRRPLANPSDFPATDEFLTGLLEFDTRDLYDPADDRFRVWDARLDPRPRRCPELRCSVQVEDRTGLRLWNERDF